jgi:hypothetical protein
MRGLAVDVDVAREQYMKLLIEALPMRMMLMTIMVCEKETSNNSE